MWKSHLNLNKRCIRTCCQGFFLGSKIIKCVINQTELLPYNSCSVWMWVWLRASKIFWCAFKLTMPAKSYSHCELQLGDDMEASLNDHLFNCFKCLFKVNIVIIVIILLDWIYQHLFERFWRSVFLDLEQCLCIKVYVYLVLDWINSWDLDIF